MAGVCRPNPESQIEAERNVMWIYFILFHSRLDTAEATALLSVWKCWNVKAGLLFGSLSLVRSNPGFV